MACKCFFWNTRKAINYSESPSVLLQLPQPECTTRNTIVTMDCLTSTILAYLSISRVCRVTTIPHVDQSSQQTQRGRKKVVPQTSTAPSADEISSDTETTQAFTCLKLLRSGRLPPDNVSCLATWHVQKICVKGLSTYESRATAGLRLRGALHVGIRNDSALMKWGWLLLC